MRRRFAEKGEGNLGCILWAVIVLVVAMIAWKMVPIKVDDARFHDFMIDQAKAAERRSPAAIKKAILREARKLDIPLDPKTLKVERYGDNIRMKARYTVFVEFPFFTYEWDFKHEVDRPIFIF